MVLKTVISVYLLTFSCLALCQPETQINQTDPQGRKQGHWIKRNPDSTILYDGYFSDNHPVGEFRRYYKDKTIKSVLRYSNNGREADAILYHPDGNMASRGKYVNQKKEGKWQFFSDGGGYLIYEERYSNNLRNGQSVMFFPDSSVAESVNYVNDIKHGPWIRYFPDGSVFLKSNYDNGRIDGKFEVWFENGSIQYSGQYKNDARDGLWLIYNSDGSLKYKMEYVDGITNDRQMDIDESNYLDSLQKNKSKIPDPEKTGVL
jgi:antitoxin component YwqK of YwqJK toxin-antitoxin module